jgi:hypothetical protein
MIIGYNCKHSVTMIAQGAGPLKCNTQNARQIFTYNEQTWLFMHLVQPPLPFRDVPLPPPPFP